eukprot:scaffold53718_cov18-Tisochrysis_lutea.AAC.1
MQPSRYAVATGLATKLATGMKHCQHLHMHMKHRWHQHEALSAREAQARSIVSTCTLVGFTLIKRLQSGHHSNCLPLRARVPLVIEVSFGRRPVGWSSLFCHQCPTHEQRMQATTGTETATEEERKL